MTSLFSYPDAHSPGGHSRGPLTVQLLNTTGRLILGTALAGLLMIVFTADRALWGLYFALVIGLIVLGLIVLILNRRGHTLPASYLLIGPVWVVVTISTALGGGVQSGGYMGYVGVAIAAGLLLGGRASTVVVAVSVAAGFGMALGVEQGWLPPVSTQSPIAAWSVSTLLLAVIAFLQYVASQSILDLAKRAQSSELDYRTLFEEAPDGICLIGADNRVALANPALCQMLGYEVEDLVGQHLELFVAPEDLARRPPHDATELRVPGSLKRERLLVRKDGARFPAVITSRYMPDGRFQYIVQDVTERKQAEAARRDSETRFRTLVENLPDVVTRHDRELRYLYVSPIISSLTGRPPEDFIGKTPREMRLPPALVEATSRALDMAVATGQSIEFEFSFKVENQIIYYESRAVPEPAEDGSVRSVLTVNRNVTHRRRAEDALRESERRYRSLLENIPAITYINDVGPESRTLYVSPQVEKLLGYAQQEFTDDPILWIALIHPDDRERVLAENARTELSGEPFRIDYRLITRPGRVIWVHDEAVFVKSETGQSDYWLGVWSDITERKQIEEQIRQREAILDGVAFAAEKFLRTPDWGANIQAVLEQLGQKIGASHAYLFENHLSPDGVPVASMRYEWSADGIPSDLSNPKYQNGPIVEPGFERWAEQLSRGEPFFGSLRTLLKPEAESLAERGLKSILDMPIFVGDTWWGVIGFDDVVVEREWSTVEVDALKVAANVIGAAIQRERADTALSRSETLYRHAIEAAGAAPYYLDYKTNTYAFLSDKVADITGYPLNEITPDLLGQLEQEYELLGEAAGLTKAEAVARTRSGRIKVWQNDARILTRSGQSRWVSDSSVQIFDEQGQAIGAIGILQDITERKLAEQQLRQSHEVYRRAIAAGGAVTYMQDYEAGAYSFVSEGIRQLTGYTAEQFTPELWASLIEDRELIGDCAPYTLSEAIRLARTGQIPVWRSDCRIRTREGEIKWVAESAVELMTAEGVSRGSIGILQDITDRKAAVDQVQRLNAELERRVAQRTEALRASEARFRAMNDASPLAIFVDDPDGNCVYVNAVYQAITGLGPEQVAGSGWKTSLHPADREMVAQAWADAMSRTPFVYEQVYRLLWPNGRVVWVNAKASAMSDGDRLLGYVGTLEDITSRVEAEEALRRRTAQLEAANRELEAFSYSVSHDLRAPLRAVDGFSRLLLQQYDGRLEAEAVRYLHKVRDSAQHMGRLIDDLLAFSRLGRHALRRQPLTSADMQALAQRVANELKGESPDRVIEITIHPLPPCEADLNLLNQVFVNLLSNAVKFTRPRPVGRIEVGSQDTPDGPAYFVRDNGVGFDAQYRHKMFGVFQRLHRMEEFEGTGVGLAIVQRIIHRHGGRIWAESVQDQGATFYFTIGRPPGDED